MPQEAIERSVKQFDNWSKTYDFSFWSYYFSRAIRFVLKKAPHLGPEDSILDLGCGTGNLCLTFSKNTKVGKIWGVDASPEMIKKAKNKIQNRNNTISYIIGFADNIPLPDASVNIIFCLNSFHHYPDHSKVLQEMNRVLKTNGYVVLLDPVSDGRVRRFWNIILKKIFNEPYAKFFTINEMKGFFSKYKFNHVGHYFFWYFVGLVIEKKNA